MHPLCRLAAVVLLSLPASLSLAAQHSNTVHILHHGYVTPIEGRGFLPGAQTDGARKAGSTISLVIGKDVALVADPGMAAAGKWDEILAEINSHGVRPEDVTHVFISHHHPDHLTKLGLFPNAIVVDFWATYHDDIWADHPNPYPLAPGITVLRTPGHTDEDATLLVETDDGVYALTHLWWSPGYRPAEDPLGEDPEGLVKSRQLILELADWIVPGHGAPFKNTRKTP